jgi:hypothetical protein
MSANSYECWASSVPEEAHVQPPAAVEHGGNPLAVNEENSALSIEQAGALAATLIRGDGAWEASARDLIAAALIPEQMSDG